MKMTTSGVAALMMMTTAWVAPVATASAADGPDVVLDESTFLANNDIVSTQRFDTPGVFPGDQFEITIDGVNYESSDPSDPYWEISNGRLIRAFRDFPPSTDDIGVVLTFGSDQAVHAIGFDLATRAVRDPDPFEVIAVEADGTSTVLPFDLAVTDDLFVGLSSGVGFVSVTILEGPSGGNVTNFWLDNVSRSELSNSAAPITVGGTVVRSGAGQPESDISVNLFERAANGSRGKYLGNAKTDKTGRYQHAVEPGCYVFTFIAPVGNHFLSAHTAPGNRYLNRSLCVTPGEQPVGVDVTILTDESVNASISGQVTRDGGQTVGGVSVNLFLADISTRNVRRGQYLGNDRTDDASGNYRHAVASGCYVLTFIAPPEDEFSNGTRYLNRFICVDDAGQREIDATLR